MCLVKRRFAKSWRVARSKSSRLRGECLFFWSFSASLLLDTTVIKAGLNLMLILNQSKCSIAAKRRLVARQLTWCVCFRRTRKHFTFRPTRVAHCRVRPSSHNKSTALLRRLRLCTCFVCDANASRFSRAAACLRTAQHTARHGGLLLLLLWCVVKVRHSLDQPTAPDAAQRVSSL